jgi:hypothetical protein
MTDATFKPSSGDDLVLSNDDGSKKIEIPETGDVHVTGDFKVTTVKATNLKANDGTAGLSIADSTGRVTFTDVNPVITLGSNATFPAGHVIQTKIHSEQEDIESTSGTVTTSSSCALNCTSGNVLLVWVTGGYTYSAYASSNMETGITILTSGDSTTRTYITGRYSSNNSVSGWVGSSFVALSVTATQTYTVKRAVRKVDGTGTVRWSTDGEADTCYWTMMEAKPTS